MIDPLIVEKEIWKALYKESSKYIKEIYNENSRNYKCNVPDCDRPAYAKGLCNAHYIRKRKSKDLTIPIRNRHRGLYCLECGVKITEKGGWDRCTKHYKNRRAKIIKKTCIGVLGGKCQICKKEYSLSVYDFHHIKNKKDIKNEIGNMIYNSSIKKIAIEISKCSLLCANCHRELHNGK